MRTRGELERDFLLADRAAVEELLGQLSEADALTRIGLESRLEELNQEIAGSEAVDCEPTASVALFFGGDPVVANRGIESRFGGKAVTTFQDLVSKVLASRAGGLSGHGVVPNQRSSKLHTTNVLRGSFGFLLEESEPQGTIFETSLKGAVGTTCRLLKAFAERDESQFDAEVEVLDQRILDTARGFFALMKQNRATLRIVTEDHETDFGREDVERGAERAQSVEIEERQDEVEGQLLGVLPHAHRFEFVASGDGRTIKGRVDRGLSAEQLAQFNRRFVNEDSVATFQVKRLRRRNSDAKEVFWLLAIGKADQG